MDFFNYVHRLDGWDMEPRQNMTKLWLYKVTYPSRAGTAAPSGDFTTNSANMMLPTWLASFLMYMLIAILQRWGSFCIGPWIFASTHLPWPDFDEPADFCWVIVFSAQSVSLNNNAMMTLIFRGNPHWELGNPHEATPIRWEDHLDRRGFSSRASLQP